MFFSTLLTISLFLFPPLFGQEEEEPCEARSDFLPSTLVAGHVNAINGEFSDQVTDLTLSGPEPLTLGRSYGSRDHGHDLLGRSWHLNHPQRLLLRSDECDDGFDYDAWCSEPSGAMFNYGNLFDDEIFESGDYLDLGIDLPPGSTNCSGGFPSGRTFMRNQKLFFYPVGDFCRVRTPCGDVRTFVMTGEDPEDGFLMESERKASGELFSYFFDDEEKMKSVKARTRRGRLYGDLTFCPRYYEGKSKSSPPLRELEVKGSDGSWVRYNFEVFGTCHIPGEDVSKLSYLTEVASSNNPTTRYRYEKMSGKKFWQMIGKDLPDHRGVDCEYYHRGIHEVAGRRVEIYDEEDHRLNRVKHLLGPVGHSPKRIPFCSFIYKGGGSGESGCTDLFDAMGGRVHYCYDGDHRLTALRFYGSGPKERLRCLGYVWSTSGKLLCSTIHGRLGKLHMASQFSYDEEGNVVKERVFGNLTGHGADLPRCSPGDVPHLEGVESYTRRFRYGPSPYRLLEREEEENGKRGKCSRPH